MNLFKTLLTTKYMQPPKPFDFSDSQLDLYFFYFVQREQCQYDSLGWGRKVGWKRHCLSKTEAQYFFFKMSSIFTLNMPVSISQQPVQRIDKIEKEIKQV